MVHVPSTSHPLVMFDFAAPFLHECMHANYLLSTFVIFNIFYLPCHALLHHGVVYDTIYNCSRLFLSILHWDILYDLTFSWRRRDRRHVYGWIQKYMYLVSLMVWMYKGFFRTGHCCYALLFSWTMVSYHTLIPENFL
jgi:hypothetical protein